MALVIGVGFGPSTWGALRSVIFNGTLSGSPVTNSGDHNVEYVHGFKTTDGNGFVRTDYGALYNNSTSKQYGPNFYAYITSGTSAKFASEYQTSSVGMLINEDRAQLTGETVVLSSGSITMASSAFVSPFQTFTATSTPTITSIGKLTAF
jgi:hypothetical protein